MVDAAEIKIWGENVGAVRWDENRRLAFFEYDKKFVSLDWNIAPFKMPVKDGARIYSFPELRKSQVGSYDTFKGLPGLLSDSLPDRYGNQLINTWLAQQGRAPESMNPVEKLCFIGNRGMGALEFEPAQFSTGKRSTVLEINSLVEIAKRMLNYRESFETNLQKDETKAIAEILKIGTSAGGARPKALIAYNPKSGIVKSGQGNAPEGFEHWLIKLDGVSDTQFGESSGWGRVEYAYYLMAKACGIEMMDCKLLEENNRAHFLTRRFDRDEKSTKHHIQTLCAISHFDYNDMFAYSYEQLYQTMRTLKLSFPEAEQMFRRMVFNVLAANCDDHTKNFTFRLKKDESWKLAPAYDLCFAYDPDNIWVSRHTLSINGKRENFTKDDLLTIAKSNSIKKGESIIDEINPIIKNWKDFASQAKVSDKLTQRIDDHLQKIKL
jgi:serine/threonine-protein kinase HipA